MQPQSSNRPVMDVSAPRAPQPAHVEVEPQGGPISVQPAPSANALPPAAPAVKASAPAKKPIPPEPQATAPVGVITVAVLAMMFMSVMAVVVYLTSKA